MKILEKVMELCDKRNVSKCPYTNPLMEDKCSMFYQKKYPRCSGLRRAHAEMMNKSKTK